MFRVRQFATLIVVAALSTHQIAFAASIEFGLPESGQNYAVGAPIDYTGSGTWQITPGADGKTDLRTQSVRVSLVYTPNSTKPGTGAGVIISTVQAIMTYDYNTDGSYKGSYTFENAVLANGTSNLVAKQNTGSNSQYYWLRMLPLDTKGIPYVNSGSSTIVNATVKLGFIS